MAFRRFWTVSPPSVARVDKDLEYQPQRGQVWATSQDLEQDLRLGSHLNRLPDNSVPNLRSSLNRLQGDARTRLSELRQLRKRLRLAENALPQEHWKHPKKASGKYREKGKVLHSIKYDLKKFDAKHERYNQLSLAQQWLDLRRWGMGLKFGKNRVPDLYRKNNMLNTQLDGLCLYCHSSEHSHKNCPAERLIYCVACENLTGFDRGNLDGALIHDISADQIRRHFRRRRIPIPRNLPETTRCSHEVEWCSICKRKGHLAGGCHQRISSFRSPSSIRKSSNARIDILGSDDTPPDVCESPKEKESVPLSCMSCGEFHRDRSITCRKGRRSKGKLG